MNYLGDWKSTSLYQMGNVVLYNNALYISIKNSWNPPNRNKLPDQETSWWMQLVTAGNTVLKETLKNDSISLASPSESVFLT